MGRAAHDGARASRGRVGPNWAPPSGGVSRASGRAARARPSPRTVSMLAKVCPSAPPMLPFRLQHRPQQRACHRDHPESDCGKLRGLLPAGAVRQPYRDRKGKRRRLEQPTQRDVERERHADERPRPASAFRRSTRAPAESSSRGLLGQVRGDPPELRAPPGVTTTLDAVPDWTTDPSARRSPARAAKRWARAIRRASLRRRTRGKREPRPGARCRPLLVCSRRLQRHREAPLGVPPASGTPTSTRPLLTAQRADSLPLGRRGPTTPRARPRLARPMSEPSREA